VCKQGGKVPRGRYPEGPPNEGMPNKLATQLGHEINLDRVGPQQQSENRMSARGNAILGKY
jgi:hypothetical protein